VEGFIDWINNRTAGIRASGATNVKSAVEFNIVNDLLLRDMPSVLFDVIPNVDADVFSYSSYESINPILLGDDGSILSADIETIRSVLEMSGHDPNSLILGEFGLPVGGRSSNLCGELKTIMNTACEAGIDKMFAWILIDSGSYGLYNNSAGATDAGSCLEDYIAGLAVVADPENEGPEPATPFLPREGLAAGVPGSNGAVLSGQGPCSGLENLASCIVNIYRWALGVAVLLALVMIIFAGYLYMTAGGDAQRVASAKEKFTNAFIGIIILFAAVLILRTINPDLVLLPEDPLPNSSGCVVPCQNELINRPVA